MAMLVPVWLTDELFPIDPPGSLQDALNLLGAKDVTTKRTTDAIWVLVNKTKSQMVVNERVSNWLADRGAPCTVYGPVLYLSNSEVDTIPWVKLLPSMPQGTLTVKTPPTPPRKNNSGKEGISGNTYPVKEQLKLLGATWDPDIKQWMVPPDKVAEAKALVARGC